ncbi:MAG: DUF2752 domain-containing protein [Myxococcales bacterium]|nr:DUF2752 domain-containing protein [Myxococcales bacterium]
MSRVLGWLDAISRRPWFGEGILFAGALAIVLLAMLMSPSAGAVSFFGFDVPVLCGFRRLTGIGCPGCGLTRSFVFLGHGQWAEGFRMNWLGPPLFAFVVVQIPFRLYRMLRTPPPSDAGTARAAPSQVRPS